MFGLLFAGVWVGVALGVTGIVIMMIWGGGLPLIGGAVWGALHSYGFTALPGFIFVGEVILRSGLSSLAFKAIAPLASRLPGKLLQVNIMLCTMFGAMFGASAACVAAVGGIVIPELRQRKYKEELILGTICVAGTLAFMLPPSSQFVIYGSLVDVSIGALFAAGIIPGLIMAGSFMFYLWLSVRIDPTICPPDDEGENKKVPLKQQLIPLLKLWPLLLIIGCCIVPIYVGLATPTESAGLGAAAAVIVGLAFGELRVKLLWDCCRDTTRVCAMLFFIIVGASIMSGAVSQLGMPRQVVQGIVSLDVSYIWIMAAIYLLYLILGCVFDGISMQVMTLPFIFPIIVQLGFDPVWFGVIMCLLVEVGMVTPPVGMNLFIVQAVAGKQTALSTIFRGSAPFLGCCVVVLILLTIFPGLATWLPKALGQY